MKTTNFTIVRSLILGLFFIFSATSIFAASSSIKSESEGEEEEFNVTEMIMHHVTDSHDFHILDWDGHAVSFPLPVILWTDNGLVTFMSSEFHHDDLGIVVVEKDGQKFVKYHEEIYYASNSANADGSYIKMGEGDHPSNAHPIDFSITKLVFSMFM